MSKNWIYPTGLIIALIIAFFSYQKYHVAPSIDLKELSLSDLQGNKFNIESLKGKKVILSFGASWCGNCIEELEVLSKIYGKELAGIEIVVISDESLEKIERFKTKRNYPFTFVKLTHPFNEIGINSIPSTYLVNTDLTVVKETVGYMNWEDASNREHFIKLMD